MNKKKENLNLYFEKNSQKPQRSNADIDYLNCHYHIDKDVENVFIEVCKDDPLSIETEIRLCFDEKSVNRNPIFDPMTIKDLVKLTEEEFDRIVFTNVDKKCISDIIATNKPALKQDKELSTIFIDKMETNNNVLILKNDVSDFFDILTARRLKLAKIRIMEDFTNLTVEEFNSKFLTYPKQTYDSIIKILIKVKIKFKKYDLGNRNNINEKYLNIVEEEISYKKIEAFDNESELPSLEERFQLEISQIFQNKDDFARKKIYFPIYIQRKRLYVYKILDKLHPQEDKLKLLAYLLSKELISNNDVEGFKNNTHRDTLEIYKTVLVNNQPIQSLELSSVITETLLYNNIKYMSDLLNKTDSEIRLLKYQGMVITDTNYFKILDFIENKKLKLKNAKYDGRLVLEYAVKFVQGLIEGSIGHVLNEKNVNLFMYLLENSMKELTDIEKKAIITKYQLDGCLYNEYENESEMTERKYYAANNRAINKIMCSCYFVEVRKYILVKTMEEKLVDIEFILDLVTKHK